MGYFICLIVGATIGFMTCAVLSQSKYSDEHEHLIKYYEDMLKVQCIICPFKEAGLK